jgi:hypothetical protein
LEVGDTLTSPIPHRSSHAEAILTSTSVTTDYGADGATIHDNATNLAILTGADVTSEFDAGDDSACNVNPPNDPSPYMLGSPALPIRTAAEPQSPIQFEDEGGFHAAVGFGIVASPPDDRHAEDQALWRSRRLRAIKRSNDGFDAYVGHETRREALRPASSPLAPVDE